ncbi:MAG TPA: alcohol dehydrogenase catalytic domain-containing protein [Caldilineaceae bacterium]|nr:alcohol dehydrogenase catalytic domain-containing protein [Caldilineaceae bacterium]
MTDKLAEYKEAKTPLPEHNRLWPLYGAGFENLGRDGKMIEVPMPSYGPNELLVRHDATGICFSDIKVIRAGQSHPRIYRDMSQEPVVLGHEVSLTVVGVGENLRDQYKVGDRFIVQADIYVGGVGYAYGYEIQGGFSQYNVIDQRVLNGDGGNYLLRVRPTTGYAEAALNEPWACVEASYTVTYRTTWKPGGTVWLVGDGRGMSLGRAQEWRPERLALDLGDEAFADEVRSWAEEAGVTLIADSSDIRYDDIVVLSADPNLIERAFPRLAKGGVFAVVTDQEVPRPVQLDIGRLHYDHLAVLGATGADLSAAYAPIRTQLRPGGLTWILGAGGPMGHMHLQRALEIEGRPRKIVATNLHLARLRAVEEKFTAPAQAAGVELACFSQESFPDEAALSARLRAESGGRGYDDIAVMAPSVPAIEMAMPHLADGGVMNVFAGLPRGTQAHFDMNAIVRRGVRYTGTSGSSIEDLAHMLDLTERRVLSTNKSVAAVAGLEGVAEGLRAVAEGRFPGKVVIFPNLSKPLPLTTLDELQERLPSVYAKLDEDGNWTVEAEEELLRLLL